MSPAKVLSAELEGVEAKLIEVEVDINVGLHSFNIVGLADKALSEAKERVNAALKNTGVKPPNRENRKITVNLAPADVKKTGSQYDLAIAIGYLLATGQIKPFNTEDKIIIGELSLDGALRPINGALNIAHYAKQEGFKEIILPLANAKEVSLIEGIHITPVKDLGSAINHLEEKKKINSYRKKEFGENPEASHIEISEIKGQENAKRALTIAAAGGHHMIMVGPPGSGKSMLAQALASILPRPTLPEVIEVSKIYSAAGLLNKRRSYIDHRPFRAPHHTASPVAVIGGGPSPKPGEISLAHRGILFLDELPEFRRDVLESLRQSLENGSITVSRIRNNLTFPARFTLVTAMNPCPCGFYGDPEKECKCSAYEVFRYQKKISGPLLDRIDIQIVVPRAKIETLRKASNKDETRQTRENIKNARIIQKRRFESAGLPILVNAEMSSKQCESLISLSTKADEFLKERFNQLVLSARAYYRILKTAQTIADLEQSEKVNIEHLAEAFQYRIKENE